MSTQSSAATTIDYKVSMPLPHTHYFEVEMNISGLNKSSSIDLKLPVWSPGSYLLREFSKSIEGFSAHDNSGKKLGTKKTNKNTWQIQEPGTSLSIKYKVYAFEMSVRTSFLDDSHGYINGTSVFMFIDGQTELASTVQIVPYQGWKTISTSLDKVAGKKFTFSSPNYDVLVDSPIEIGNHLVFDFNASGVKHTVAMYGKGNFDVAKLKTDMASCVEACTSVFGQNPNEEYLFIIHNLDKGSGGLEHTKSTSLQVNRWTYSDSKYIDFLGLVTHEYFHLWNVKRIRPIELGPFNYDEENYTRSLWVMEGFTSYYDELLLSKAGIVDSNHYLNKLMGAINSIENQAGNDVLPVANASFDAWIKAYRPNENSRNTTISYYTKGSVIAAMLDLIIIDNSKGKKNLDDVLKTLYETYYENKGRGFTEEELKETIEQIANTNLDDFFNDYIYGTQSIDYQKYLSLAGFDIINDYANVKKPSMGASLSEANGRLVIKSVQRGSSAYESGLNVNDEIIALDGYRVDKTDFDKLFNMLAIGSKANILVSRDGILKSMELKVIKDTGVRYLLKSIGQSSKNQKRCFNKWMRQN